MTGMGIEMKLAELFKSIDAFEYALVEKGYDRCFMAATCYPDSLSNSIKRYLFASIEGYKPGMLNGLNLSTYLKWNGDYDQRNVAANFKVDLNGQYRLIICRMEIHTDESYLKKHRCLTLFPKSTDEIPTKVEAIKMFDSANRLKSHRKMSR
ncbi:hypothetical protein PV783_24955 [Chitinophaga sp. CC14]|uniref:hypothetical protein n=1 Tax=Chitinophaga sp. CC14 TaxID=3029199 RepID=UPI003B76D035